MVREALSSLLTDGEVSLEVNWMADLQQCIDCSPLCVVPRRQRQAFLCSALCGLRTVLNCQDYYLGNSLSLVGRLPLVSWESHAKYWGLIALPDGKDKAQLWDPVSVSVVCNFD